MTDNFAILIFKQMDDGQLDLIEAQLEESIKLLREERSRRQAGVI